MTRTQRFLDSVWLGYTNQSLIMLVGLWLTPFLLRHFGQHDYGLWLVGMQMLMYLSLLDVGVVALLPREIAYATGRAGSWERAEDLPLIIGRTARVVLYQLPLVVAALMVTWFVMPGDWQVLRGPAALAMAAFGVVFPLRMFQALLQGLQDTRFLGVVQILTWALSMMVIIALVINGAGLYALAVGWAFTQILSASILAYRLQSRFRSILPRRLPPMALPDVLSCMSRGLWISFNQIAGFLTSGADTLIIGNLLGPTAVVPYNCTGKLVSVLANQPNLLMQAAAPGLSELRAGESRERLLRAITALTQGVLMLSGALVTVILVVNPSFVRWWVGPQQYGGSLLTVLIAFNMLLRHWNTTAMYGIFCLGHERRMSITNAIDGLFTAIAMLILIPQVGVVGAPVASIISLCLVSLPANLSALRRDIAAKFSTMLMPLWPWCWRFVLLCVVAMVAARLLAVSSFWSILPMSVIGGVVYVVVMFRPGRYSLLGSYLHFQLSTALQKTSFAKSAGD